MIALRPDDNMQAVFATWMVAAPFNNPLYVQTEGKRYKGVGGHLFAIAAQKSVEYGYGGAIAGFAANKELMLHYQKMFNAIPICMLHPYQIFIPEDSAQKIQEVYDYDWTEDII